MKRVLILLLIALTLTGLAVSQSAPSFQSGTSLFCAMRELNSSSIQVYCYTSIAKLWDTLFVNAIFPPSFLFFSPQDAKGVHVVIIMTNLKWQASVDGKLTTGSF